jgi:hypothetical protein
MAIFAAATLARPEGTLKNCRHNAEECGLAALVALNRSGRGNIRMAADRYQIGESTLDLALGRLCRDGADVPLRPKSFACSNI